MDNFHKPQSMLQNSPIKNKITNPLQTLWNVMTEVDK